MKKIISIVDILHCNAYLKEQNKNYKIHLRDACGKQSCWIEPLSESVISENLISLLDAFFLNLGFHLEYSDDKQNFWLIQDEIGK